MKDFFKMLLASCLGSMIMFGIGIFLVFALIIGSVASIVSMAGNTEKTVVVTSNSVLQLDLTKSVYERAPSDLDMYLEGNQVLGADMILKSINNAKYDDNINGQ